MCETHDGIHWTWTIGMFRYEWENAGVMSVSIGKEKWRVGYWRMLDLAVAYSLGYEDARCLAPFHPH